MKKIETEPTEKEAELTKEQAKGAVMELWQQAYSMGANDSEYETFKDILEQLEAGEITPQQAVEQANQTRYSKQDYH